MNPEKILIYRLDSPVVKLLLTAPRPGHSRYSR